LPTNFLIKSLRVKVLEQHAISVAGPSPPRSQRAERLLSEGELAALGRHLSWLHPKRSCQI
jgi:hypothetical protein